MFETTIVVVGNVLTAPEWRRTKEGHLVANFRVASTARRVDRDSGRWVDGDSLRLRVSCWRRLAEGVAASIAVGDPVVVAGRLRTRDWTDQEGQARVSYEMDALAVGHDLARGRGRFYRRTAQGVTTTEETEATVRGEPAEPVDEAPVEFGDGVPADDGAPDFPEVIPAGPMPAESALSGRHVVAAAPDPGAGVPAADDAGPDVRALVEAALSETPGAGPEAPDVPGQPESAAPRPRRPRRQTAGV